MTLVALVDPMHRGFQPLIRAIDDPFPLFGGRQVTDATGFESLTDLDELRERLTRGGLAPEAVTKAMEAYEAGEMQSVPIIIGKGDVLRAEIADDLLRKVFPVPGLSTLAKGELLYLEYSINRHRFGKKSLTLKWPDGNELEEEVVLKDQEGNVIEGDEEVPAETPEKDRDPRKEANRDEDPWPVGEPPPLRTG